MASFTIAPAARSTGVRLLAPATGVLISTRITTATVTLVMPIDAERANSSQHIDFGIDLLTPPSTVWKLSFLSAGWNGGGGPDKHSTVLNPPGVVTLDAAFIQAWTGNSVRLFAQLREPATLGATVEVL